MMHSGWEVGRGAEATSHSAHWWWCLQPLTRSVSPLYWCLLRQVQVQPDSDPALWSLWHCRKSCTVDHKVVGMIRRQGGWPHVQKRWLWELWGLLLAPCPAPSLLCVSFISSIVCNLIKGKACVLWLCSLSGKSLHSRETYWLGQGRGAVVLV